MTTKIDGNGAYSIVADLEDITRDEWLELRKTGIGGSDIGAIAGLSKWKTPLAVYMDKLGQAPPVEETEVMYWGNVLEEVVAQEFSKRSGRLVERFPYMMRSTKYPWMLANIDRILVSGVAAGLECKSTHAANDKKWADGKVPEDYILQCYHYMIVTGLKNWHIACLIGGQKFVYYEIQYDEAIAEAVITMEREFWEKVQKRVPPAAWSEDVDLMSALFNAPTDDTITLDSGAIALVQQYVRAAADEKAAAAEKDAAKAKLCGMIGNHSKAIAGEYAISWPSVSTDRLDSKKLKAERPEVYKQYVKKTPSRRFSVK